MELPGTIARGYFSPSHFARDYLYSAAAVLLTAVAAAAYSCEFRSLASTLTTQEPTPLLVATLLLFVSSHGLGFLANSMAALPIGWVVKWRSKASRSPYHSHYENAKAVIDRLYAQCLGGAVGPDRPATRRDKVNQLIEFCRQHESGGYVHLVRNYALISFHRQVFVYFFLLGIGICFFEFTWHVSWLFGISTVEAFNQARMVRETARNELNFISATCARLRNQRRRTDHAAQNGA